MGRTEKCGGIASGGDSCVMNDEHNVGWVNAFLDFAKRE